MKVRNILIGLLVVLMAFVFISCEDEPEEQVQPTPVDDTVYKLTATKGINDAVFDHDKFSIWFKEAVEPGATISMEFRSTADFFQMNVRGIGGSPKYVYEEDIKEEGNTFKLEPLSDGWTKFSYTFADDAVDSEDFRVDFRGWIVAGEIMELRHVFYNGQQIALSEENMSGTDYAAPTIEAIADHEWTTPESYIVAYFIGTPSSVDKYPVVETVAKGGKVSLAGLAKDNYDLSVFWYDKDGKKGDAFDKDTDTISADTFLLLEYKGVDVNITFHKNYLGAEDEALETTTEFGKAITPPATDDWKRDGWKITGWTTAAEASEDNVFNLSEAVASTEAIEIYAQWSNVVTLTLNWNYGDTPETTDVDVNLGTAPAASKMQVGRPGWILSGWTVGPASNSGAYDYTTVLNEDKTIYAQWTEATQVYKLTATKGSDGYDANKNSQDKFRLIWSDTLSIQPGDVLTIAFKAERLDAMTADRDFTYSIRGLKKWFSEKPKGTAYPKFWSTFDDSSDDGWVYASYVFPEATAETDQTVSYPATYFYVDFRDNHMAVAGATYDHGTPDDDTDDITCTVSDVLYIKGFALNGQMLTLDQDAIEDAYCDPTIEEL